jgi:hypothetical protein
MAGNAAVMTPDTYRQGGRLTRLTAAQLARVAEVGDDPLELCRAAQHLLLPPGIPTGSGAPRQDERNVRPAEKILDLALRLDDRALSLPRPPDRRVIGTCRHFAVLSCAFLRGRGIAARARCGFATYFEPGLSVDHWITECWSEHDRRWLRIDSEILGLDLGLGVDATDLAPGAFLSGPEAWQRYRDGADPMTFGVHQTENWGAAEIIGNAIRDLAALHRIEMLPWDEWGPMRACYDGTVTDEVEQFMDALAGAAASPEEAGTTELFECVPVPDPLIA